MSTVATRFTLSEMILLSASKLDEQGQTPFSAEDLIVTSWREYPRSFGLKGYAEQFPDSNRVLSAIMGEKGLARKGWLSKMGQKLYALSKEGREVVRLMTGESIAEVDEQEDDEALACLPRDQERVLIALFGSSAFKKMKSRKGYELSFSDACRFWDITENQSSEALDGRLSRVENLLDKIEHLIEDGLKVQGEDIRGGDVERLRETHEYLLERFSRHLTLLRSR